MKLIEPSCEYWEQQNIVTHIARCARVCYANEKNENSYEKDEALVKRLIESGHVSMLRHGTLYYIVPSEIFKDRNNLSSQAIKHFIGLRITSPYIYRVYDAKHVYISTNKQFIKENPCEALKFYAVTPERFFEYEVTKPIRRFTFYLTTQLGTTRELNRVSPNNIAEQSTRYCNYSKNKFENEIQFCKPHWYDNCNDKFKEIYNSYLINSEAGYFKLLEEGFLPQDARGVLPLDTASKVAYTYTFEEWAEIINKRYFGTTGKPHPNAKIIIGMVLDKFKEMGYITYDENPENTPICS